MILVEFFCLLYLTLKVVNYKYSFRENFENFRRKLTELTLHFSDKSYFFCGAILVGFFALFRIHLIFDTNQPKIRGRGGGILNTKSKTEDSKIIFSK